MRIKYVDRYLTIAPYLGISKGTNFVYRSATLQKTNSFSNFIPMALKIIMLYLPAIFMVFSCVENRIYIHLHPDQQTYFKFESRGDSTDVFDQDFLHPKNIPDWNSLSKTVEKGSEKNWYLITEGALQDTSRIFFYNDRVPLGYSFKKNIAKSWISTKYDFKLIFSGRRIKTEYPRLHEAILSEKMDSLNWLPEALTILMHKGLEDIARDSLTPEQSLWNKRLVNHLRNSFARMTRIEDLEYIQSNREQFLTDLLKPFNVNKDLPANLAQHMEKHEQILKASMDLNDDSFLIKLLMPGQTISANATSTKKDTLIWNFGLDSLLSDTYTLRARSIVYAIDRMQKTLISVGILLLLLIGNWLRKRS